MQPSEVFVRLLDEGTDAFRPVPAVLVKEALYRLGGAVPEDESWEFLPGTTVRCHQHRFADGTTGLLAVESAV
jgi:hypothetical protein